MLHWTKGVQLKQIVWMLDDVYDSMVFRRGFYVACLWKVSVKSRENQSIF